VSRRNDAARGEAAASREARRRPVALVEADLLSDVDCGVGQIFRLSGAQLLAGLRLDEVPEVLQRRARTDGVVSFQRGLELGDARADRLDDAGDVDAADRDLRPA
jgi:hypothetical protein